MRPCLKLIMAAIGLSMSISGSAAQPDTRPNILFCIADDWSWPHASVLGDKTVRTPNIDALARSGVVFQNAFCAAPSCTPSRAAILTGKYPHELAEGGNLWGFLPAEHRVVPDILEEAGYAVGFARKGWGPGHFQAGGRKRNPAGPSFRNFDTFLEQLPPGKPFWFWFGSQDPHRPYEKGSGARAGLKTESVEVPGFLPDTPEVRNDILDYYLEVQRFDRDVGELVDRLRQRGLLTNTIIIVTADNGMPFPRAKANLYDGGARIPLIVAGQGVAPRGLLRDFVSLVDLAPSMLELAGLPAPTNMAARSIVPAIKTEAEPARDHVFVERERHANVRKGDLSYPARAVRTGEFLYIRNLRPDRWPAGDPEMHKAVGPFGDCDNSPSKSFLMEHRSDAGTKIFFELAFSLRPAEELYHLPSDPFQTNNVADSPQYLSAKRNLAETLDRWMWETRDPRTNAQHDAWTHYPYYGGGPMPENRPSSRPGR